MAAGVAAVTVLGALIGSFLTVVAHRVPERESIVSPGSACTSCLRPLRWRENIPVVSWLVLRGRCAGCGARISPRYPLVEAGTAVAFGLVAAVRGIDVDLVLELPFTAVLIVLAVIDVERRVVPNPIVLVAGLYAVGAGAIVDLPGVPEQVVAGAAAFIAFLLITLAYPAGMGMGDVKLATVMGLYLGIDVIPAFLAAFLSGSVIGLALIVRGGVGQRKKAVPFVPFLAFGGLVGLLAGAELIELYSDRFL